MESLLTILIESMLRDAATYLDSLFSWAVSIAFYAEKIFDNVLGVTVMSELQGYLFYFGISLIILKFVQKGFNTYILWIDGDADTEPIVYLTYFFKAMVVAISFPTLYGWMATIVEELTNKLLSTLSRGLNPDFTFMVTYITSNGIVQLILGLVYFTFLFLLYFQFLRIGLEIVVLRLGIPIACVGLIDSDQGFFKTYMQKFFQSMATVMIQVVLLKLSLAFIVNSQIFWAITAIAMALGTPRFLQEFMVPRGAGGNMLGKAYYASQMIRIIRR